jgi:DNA-binding NarL/FixJ family response regulator
MFTMTSHPNRNITVFTADDSLIVQDRLRTILDELTGVDIVGQVGTVTEAISTIRRLQPDVVILDLRLPGGSGIDVLHQIRQNGVGAIVIILTNYTFAGYRQKCLDAGADFFLDKSTEFDQIPGLFERFKQDQN